MHMLINSKILHEKNEIFMQGNFLCDNTPPPPFFIGPDFGYAGSCFATECVISICAENTL